MKRIFGVIVMVAAVAAMAFALVGCGGASSSSQPSSQSGSQSSSVAKEVTYESILDDYSKKMADATPGLVEEYKAKSADLKGNVQALAELSNEQVGKLAEICTEGVGEMAKLMNKNKDEYSVYEDWAGKLQAVYQEDAKQITDAYMASAM